VVPRPSAARAAPSRRARRLGLVLGLAAAACWGLGPVATKAALAGFSPEVVGLARLGITAFCLRLLGGRDARWLPRDRWSVLAGVALGVDFLLYNHGVRLTTAALAGLLVNFGQVSNVILGRTVLGEPLTARRLLGAALTLAGVGIINAPAALAEAGSLAGNLLVMLASVAWSTYAVAQRRAPRRGGNLFQLMAPIFTVATLVSVPALLVPAAWHNPGGTGAALMLAVLVGGCTIAPYLFYSHGQEVLDLVVMTVVLASTPIFAVALAWLILGEPVGWPLAAGGAVVLAGILVVAVER
jgi:O-acetylserine/cysteine efflux transporter